MFHKYMSGYTFYDCGCPHVFAASWDSHGQASEKLLKLMHKLLGHSNEGFATDDWEEYDDYYDGMY